MSDDGGVFDSLGDSTEFGENSVDVSVDFRFVELADGAVNSFRDDVGEDDMD